jgi:hypothetical protein
MNILACGGRDYDNREYMDKCLSQLMVTLLIHGNAKGADTQAGQWAADKGLPVLIFPALWHKEGKAAGIKRNIRMLEEGRPDLVVAFAGGRGTAHMKSIAKAAGVPVWDTAESEEFNVGTTRRESMGEGN